MIRALWLGRVEYSAAWQLQRELAELRSRGEIDDTLLLLEHPPTITLGRGADRENLLASPEQLARLGVEVHEIDRGGDVTWHGPGQLVGYPIFDLASHRRDLHWFLRQIEEALIQTLAAHGIGGRRFPPHTGVWVCDRKIAAIGVKVSRWICTHGFALNVSPDLAAFELIVPCGIREYGVTSMLQEAGTAPLLPAAASAAAAALACVFDRPLAPSAALTAGLSAPSQKILGNALDASGGLC